MSIFQLCKLYMGWEQQLTKTTCGYGMWGWLRVLPTPDGPHMHDQPDVSLKYLSGTSCAQSGYEEFRRGRCTLAHCVNKEELCHPPTVWGIATRPQHIGTRRGPKLKSFKNHPSSFRSNTGCGPAVSNSDMQSQSPGSVCDFNFTWKLIIMSDKLTENSCSVKMGTTLILTATASTAANANLCLLCADFSHVYTMFTLYAFRKDVLLLLL